MNHKEFLLSLFKESVLRHKKAALARIVRPDTRPQRRTLGRLQGRYKLPSVDSPPVPPTPDDFLDALEN